jgi:glycosyltransferase involved in cell wall biosynthesis
MAAGKIVMSINASWNIFNFRKDLVRALQDAGYHVTALAPEDEYSPRLVSWGMDFRPIRIDQKGMSPLRDLRLLRDYRTALREIDPDLFLGYTIKPNIYGSLAAHSLGIAVINNVSGLGTAFLGNGLLTRLASALYKAAFRRSSTIFFQNQDDRTLFLDKGLVQTGQTGLLPGSGIDLAYFAPSPDPRPPGPFRFLFIGRLLRDKGIREFVTAARQVRRQYHDTRFELLGFADAANRTAVSRAELDSWIDEGLVDYLGASDDVRPHIRDADCIVLPSYREGLPRALLEGAAMGKPLIATDVPGCRDVVEHGRNGLLCAVRDSDALGRAMADMLSLSDVERRKMGIRGRALAEARFDRHLVSDRYLAAIGRALHGR